MKNKIILLPANLSDFSSAEICELLKKCIDVSNELFYNSEPIPAILLLNISRLTSEYIDHMMFSKI